MAFAQSLHETGYFKYGGIVTPEMNNFARIGALNGNATGQAASFPDQMCIRDRRPYELRVQEGGRPSRAVGMIDLTIKAERSPKVIALPNLSLIHL